MNRQTESREPPAPQRYYGLMILGVFIASTAVIAIKLSRTHAVMLAAFRVLIAGLVLLPAFLRALARNPAFGLPALLRRAFPPGILLGAHFIIWNIGARLTPAANASLIVNLVPVVMPFMLILLVREFLNRREIAGTAIALAGLVCLGITDYQANPDYAAGDALCFASMIFLAAYLALARKNRGLPSIWLYLSPVYLTAALFCLAAGAVTGAWRGVEYNAREILIFLFLGLAPTAAGHSLYNFILKHVRGQVMALTNLGQFVFSGVMACFILGELPPPSFYPVSALLLTGAGAVILSRPRKGLKNLPPG